MSGERVYTKAAEADEWRELGFVSEDGIHFGVDLAKAGELVQAPPRGYRADFSQQLASVNRTISFTYPRGSGKSIMQQIFGDEWAAYYERQARRARLSGFERICEDLGYSLPKPTLDGRRARPSLYRVSWPVCDSQWDLHIRLEQWWVNGIVPVAPRRAQKAGVR